MTCSRTLTIETTAMTQPWRYRALRLARRFALIRFAHGMTRVPRPPAHSRRRHSGA